LDFVVFAICLWVVDGCGFKRGVKPLAIIGMNAITVYMISELMDEGLSALDWRGPLFRAVFTPLASPMNASLLYAMAYTALMWLIAFGMYRRGWFWRV
jgi:predicted acyltransferase